MGNREEVSNQPPLSAKRGIEDYVALVFFLALAGIVFSQFVSRYVFNDSIPWTEEVSRYLLIYVTFIGSAVAVRDRTHIMVEFLYRYFSSKVVKTLYILVDLVVIVFCLWCTWYAYQLTQLTQNQYMASLDVSKSYVYGAVMIGFGLMSLRALQTLWRNLKGDAIRNPSEPNELLDMAD